MTETKKEPTYQPISFDDERLADVGANDQDGEAEGRDDELGADHAARDA